MSDGAQKEDKFSREIDKLLSGEKISRETVKNKEYGSEIDFAGKIIECRAEPSHIFKNKLKGELLQRLADKERKPSFWEQIINVFTSPAWRTAAVPVTVFILAIVTIMWGLGVFTPESPIGITSTATTATTDPGILGIPPGSGSGLNINAENDKVEYLPGQTVLITITFENSSNAELVIDQFPPDLAIVNQDNPADTIRVFKAGKSSLELAPKESYNYVLTWDQLDNNGNQVANGNYILEAGETDRSETAKMADVSVLPIVISGG